MAVSPISVVPGTTLTSTLSEVFKADSMTTITTNTLSNPTSASGNVVVTIERAGEENSASGTTGSSPIQYSLVPGRQVASGATSVVNELNGLVLNKGDSILMSGNGIVFIASGMIYS